MKHGKKPSRKQADRIKALKLNPDNWFVERDLPERLVLVHRVSGAARTLWKKVC